MKTDEEIIERALREFKDKKDWMEFSGKKAMLEMDVRFNLKKSLALQKAEFEKMIDERIKFTKKNKYQSMDSVLFVLQELKKSLATLGKKEMKE